MPVIVLKLFDYKKVVLQGEALLFYKKILRIAENDD